MQGTDDFKRCGCSTSTSSIISAAAAAGIMFLIISTKSHQFLDNDGDGNGIGHIWGWVYVGSIPCGTFIHRRWSRSRRWWALLLRVGQPRYSRNKLHENAIFNRRGSPRESDTKHGTYGNNRLLGSSGGRQVDPFSARVSCLAF